MATNLDNGSITDDERERELWLASRGYMGGQLDMKDLEEIEDSHIEDLRKAVIGLAKRSTRGVVSAGRGTIDEEEKDLWVASRNYMSGDLSVKQLEDVEDHHTHDLRVAAIRMAKRSLKQRLLRILGINKKRSPGVTD